MASDTSLVHKAGLWGHQGVVLLTTGEVMHKNPPGACRGGVLGMLCLPPSKVEDPGRENGLHRVS